MSDRLFVEFAECAAKADRRHFDWLERQGVPREFLCGGAQRFGIAEIVPSNSGFYEPFDGGQRAIVMLALPLVAPWEWQAGDDIEHVGDLIAWRPEDPGRWWCRTGLMPILNPSAIEAARYEPPLRVHPSPIDWMRACGDGVVILDPMADLRFWFGGIPQIAAETVELGKEIDRRLREPPVKLPKILVPGERRAA